MATTGEGGALDGDSPVVANGVDYGNQNSKEVGGAVDGSDYENYESKDNASGKGWRKVVGATGLLGHSDSLWDAWLTAAAAQVGQVVLTYPTTLAQMGVAWGLVALIGFGLLGAWGVYLLSWLFFEYQAKLNKQRPLKKGLVLQYHDVIGGVAGKLAGHFTFVFIIGSLFLASVIQLVSSASNLYYANDNLDKRQWAFVSGAISMLSIFIPKFSHFRGIAVLGMASTSIAAVYLLIAAHSHGQVGTVAHTGPKDNQLFFTGVTNAIFTFGGHGITIEIMDAMKRPKKFNYLYLTVVAYTAFLIIPSSVSVYWAYGDLLLRRGNAISVVPKSGWRTLAISCMVLHQCMAYILFMVPVFITVEKAFGVHNGRYISRTLVRIPIVLAAWFVALAIPFFGLINSVMGAVIVTIGAYTIPPAAFFIVYRSSAARECSVKRPPLLLGRSWVMLFIVNGLVVVGTLVVGLGWGGWASISNVVDQIDHVGFFAKCYQCPPKK